MNSQWRQDKTEGSGQQVVQERTWPASVHISSKTSRHDSTRNIVLNQHSPQPPLSLHHLDVDDNTNMKIMQEFSVRHLMTGEQ